MDLQQLCEATRFPAEAVLAIERYRGMDERTYQQHKRHFYNDRASFFTAMKQRADHRQLFLYLFVRFAADAYETYCAQGIDDRIYYDTFSDIRIWCENCWQQFGEYGIEAYYWLQEHVQLRLFRLGRLQFQPYTIDRDLTVNGVHIYRGQIVLNVHIPQGEPLNRQGVGESFEQAAAFFRGISPVFVCHSWLLYPKLADILPAGSNILAFLQQFHIFQTDYDERQAEERVFGKVSDDPSAYEEQTSLQRSLKAYLTAGGRLGNGFGVKIG